MMYPFIEEFEYDVFLTIDHPINEEITNLKNFLCDVGFETLIDDQVEEFPVHVIVKCRMIMVVFTSRFLKSDIFLQRLVNIRRGQKLTNKEVVAVLCGLSEQQVLEQLEGMDQRRLDTLDLDFDLDSGGFIAEASLLLDSAITTAEVASLSDFGNIISCRKPKKCISMLNDELFHDLPPHQVGLQLRVKELLKLLRWRYILSTDTIIVRIWGTSGIGKKTIAKAIYDKIGGNFEGKSFISNIHNKWCDDIDLQNKLISDISEIELNEIDDVLSHEQIKQVLGERRVLLVLDNMFNLNKVQTLCGWCGKGSLIFLTEPEGDFLEIPHGISYGMKRLSSEESLMLFCLHAFKRFTPTNYFWELSNRAIKCCEGLPLALEVFGSLLRNRTKEEWKRIMNNVEMTYYDGIYEKLKIACDLLTNIEKDLFFNIASFYVGQSKDYVVQVLKSSRLPVEMGMSVLIECNLVKVIDNKLYVHGLLRTIGMEISYSKPKLKYSYDVFLSFRGDDTRKSFTSHLCAALKQAGIGVYMDEERIERGENIASSLLEAIESSRISIIIFSKNYAESSWCLQELEQILQCHKTTYQEVLPIFFDVRPFEVRKQQNAFGKAWERLIKRTSSKEMRKLTINFKRAFIEVANLSGWDMHNYKTETELIDEVIETITKKLGDNKCLFVAHHPVGLEPRMQDIIQLLRSELKDVIIAGIWGMGGIGKTTVAKAVYNQVGQSFDGKCFLANIRGSWEQNNGPVYLQEQLLLDILKSRRMVLPNVEMGKTILKQKLCEKRVLVVLDDVNNEDQLKALCGSREWFGQGSRIFITTRDEHLIKILRVNHVCTMKELDDNESLELFSWHAFKQAIPEQDFIKLSRRVVSYSGGLPLALEVLGSYLFDREILIWEKVLEKLHQIPNNQIHEKLKISYDGLSDDTEKEIFLDICCFFIGKNKNFATKILNGCGLHADIGIIRLIEQSLVKVGSKNKLEMHDLLRDMGREIIREQSPEKPQKRTRLWFSHDALDVLRNETGTISIKGLTLQIYKKNSLCLKTRTFERMKNLRLLQLDNVQLRGDFGYLSENLRWLCWHGFPLESMPINFNLEKIVAIDLKWSNLVKVWENNQFLEGLRSLNLSHSHYLKETPDFSKIMYLERLIIKDCPRLSIIHPSIGDLKHILLLNVKDCKSLKHLPRSVYNLKSLKTFNLCGCSKIEQLEEDIGKMESLTTLVANQTAITQVPLSLVRLKRIKYVSLCGYEGLTCDVFPPLVLSWMSPTHRLKSLFQISRILPYLIRGISHPSFSRRYQIEEARPSTSQTSCQNTPALLEFHDQVHMERSKTLMSSLTIQVGWFNKTMDILLKRILKGCNDGELDFFLAMENYPDWLVFVNEGSLVSFNVPQVVGRHLKGVVIYIIYSSLQDSIASAYSVGIMVNNFTKATMDFYKREVATTTSGSEEWQNLVSNLEPGSEVQVEIKLGHKYMVVKKTAIYLIYVEEPEKLITCECP